MRSFNSFRCKWEVFGISINIAWIRNIDTTDISNNWTV